MNEVRDGAGVGKVRVWPSPVNEREQVVALLFSVSDIAVEIREIAQRAHE